MQPTPEPDGEAVDTTTRVALSVGDPVLGKSRLLSRQCATCIFAPGNRMHLSAGRLRDLVTETRRRERSSSATTPSPTTSTPKPSRRSAVASPTATGTQALQLIERLFGFVEVDPPQPPHPDTSARS
ncbi:hypothetical protein U2F26_34240 [Micromonospora sp. 4G57]|uniref:Uncharacterized protein n=1 Tax=Micromonospora sicca TaxID=2202420 RepID=A0ABU5JJ78_9ACTN|nr:MULTISPECIES: hypothetical protein [unclassified Micromonospora]MDZ5447709.1 hypothetical protein [Micromonospora sp. 4G57]MDZ5492611.1 hypothetical protein [Micromonospora sp. 4G53]